MNYCYADNTDVENRRIMRGACVDIERDIEVSGK